MMRCNTVSCLLVASIVVSALWSFSMHTKMTYSFEDRHLKVEAVQSSPHKILAVSYIFGTSRSYVQMFVESARYSGIDIVIVGSPPPTFPLSPNVKHVSMTWQEFAHLVSTRLFDGQELSRLVDSDNKNKINDFKPLFAFLFPELIQGYTWWGHVDNDLLLGNVRHFITDDMLDSYDVNSPLVPQDDMVRLWGPFTLYRNANATTTMWHKT